MVSKSGVQYARNIQDVKLAPPISPRPDDLKSAIDSSNNNDLNQEVNDRNLITSSEAAPPVIEFTTSEEGGTTSVTEIDNANQPPPRRWRDRTGIKKPSRFDNRFVYCIFY
jgi:hypothetical protein